MKKYLCAAIMPMLLVSQSVMATHYLGHIADSPEPTPAEIADFCAKYEQDPVAMANYKPKYDQYCKKKASGSEKKPKLPKSKITKLKLPQCLKSDANIFVIGKHLKDQSMKCSFNPNLAIVKRSKGTDESQDFRITGKPRPDQTYRLTCKLGKQRKSSDPKKGCAKEFITQPEVKTPELEQPDNVDLIPEIQPQILRPGKAQMMKVSVLNRGQSQAQRQRYQLLLALVDRDLTHSASAIRSLSSGFAPNTAEVLVRKRQWVLRIPAGGQREHVSLSMNIPTQLPDIASLFWCAYADSDRSVPEVNEGNNLNCVPASSGRQTIMRNDLSKQFGSKARQQKLEPRFVPGQEEEDRGGQRQLQDLYMALTINGSPFSADVSLDGTAEALFRWNFPSSSYVDRVFLRIKPGPIAPGDPTCPPAGTNTSEGRRLMDGWDRASMFSSPGRGLHDLRYLIISPGGSYELRQYYPGQDYSIVACGQRRLVGGDYEYSHESNVVVMRVDPTALSSDLSGEDLTEPLPFPLPELEDPLRRPRPATASCSPTVYMWFDPERPGNVYSEDAAFTVHYSVDCATSVSVSDTRFISPVPAGGGIPDSGGGETFYADAAAAGVLTGNRSFSAGFLVGDYSWESGPRITSIPRARLSQSGRSGRLSPGLGSWSGSQQE